MSSLTNELFEEDLVTLVDEDGKEHVFEIADIVGFLPALAEVIAAELEGEGHDMTEYCERLARWKGQEVV